MCYIFTLINFHTAVNFACMLPALPGDLYSFFLYSSSNDNVLLNCLLRDKTRTGKREEKNSWKHGQKYLDVLTWKREKVQK